MRFDFLWLLVPAVLMLLAPLEIKNASAETANTVAVVWFMLKIALVVGILGSVAIVGIFGGFNG